jgi:hypothetical protein
MLLTKIIHLIHCLQKMNAHMENKYTTHDKKSSIERVSNKIWHQHNILSSRIEIQLDRLAYSGTMKWCFQIKKDTIS